MSFLDKIFNNEETEQKTSDSSSANPESLKQQPVDTKPPVGNDVITEVKDQHSISEDSNLKPPEPLDAGIYRGIYSQPSVEPIAKDPSNPITDPNLDTRNQVIFDATHGQDRGHFIDTKGRFATSTNPDAHLHVSPSFIDQAKKEMDEDLSMREQDSFQRQETLRHFRDQTNVQADENIPESNPKPINGFSEEVSQNLASLDSKRIDPLESIRTKFQVEESARQQQFADQVKNELNANKPNDLHEKELERNRELNAGFVSTKLSNEGKKFFNQEDQIAKDAKEDSGDEYRKRLLEEIDRLSTRIKELEEKQNKKEIPGKDGVIEVKNLPNTDKIEIPVEEPIETPFQKSARLAQEISEIEDKKGKTPEDLVRWFELSTEKKKLDQELMALEKEERSKRRNKEFLTGLAGAVTGAAVAFASPVAPIAALVAVSFGGKLLSSGLRKIEGNLRSKSLYLRSISTKDLSPLEREDLEKKRKRNERWASILNYAAIGTGTFSVGFLGGEAIQSLTGWGFGAGSPNTTPEVTSYTTGSGSSPDTLLQNQMKKIQGDTPHILGANTLPDTQFAAQARFPDVDIPFTADSTIGAGGGNEISSWADGDTLDIGPNGLNLNWKDNAGSDLVRLRLDEVGGQWGEINRDFFQELAKEVPNMNDLRGKGDLLKQGLRMSFNGSASDAAQYVADAIKK